jgi:hypothetical protein
MMNQAYAAWMSPAGDAGAQSILKELQGLALMWNLHNAWDLGWNVNEHGGHETGLQGWMDLWTKHNMNNRWAEGGIISSPSYGLIGEAGYPEAVIPMKDGVSIPVKWLNGGSTGASEERPLNIAIQVGNQEFDAYIAHVADGVRVKAERRPIGARRI